MGIFSDSASKHVCPMPTPLVIDAPEPFVANLSFHQFNKILSGSCAAFVCVVMFVLIFMHGTHFSNPREQKKIMRISCLLPLYSIFSFLSICFPNLYVYLIPWLELFQAIALSTFFLLLCEYVAPSEERRELFFASFTPPMRKRKSNKSGQNAGLVWYSRKWKGVFQYPVISLLVPIVTCITEAVGVYCLPSSSIHFAHVWLNIISTISIVVALISIIFFYRALRHGLRPHKPVAKFAAFKLVVFSTFFLSIIFWILRSTNVLKANDKFTYSDLELGLPTMIICLLMVPLSLFFHFAYPIGPYLLSNKPVLPMDADVVGESTSPPIANKPALAVDAEVSSESSSPPTSSYQGGPLGIYAWLAMLNLMEIIRSVIFSFRISSRTRNSAV